MIPTSKILLQMSLIVQRSEFLCSTPCENGHTSPTELSSKIDVANRSPLKENCLEEYHNSWLPRKIKEYGEIASVTV